MNIEDAFANIRQSHQSGRMAHAYLIAGPVRTAGVPFATRILQMLLCEAEDAPCGDCRLCRQVSERTYPDVQWVEPQKKSRVISVDQVRQLQHTVMQTSFAGAAKGCVLLGADRLGVEGANAFLKTLEEPPGNCVFLLLTDSPQVMLPTILSRCQYVGLSGGEAAEAAWVDELMEILGEREKGTVGRVIAGPTVVYAMTDRVCRLLKGLKTAVAEAEKERAAESAIDEPAEALDARVGSRYRESRTEIMRALSNWYRDLLVCVCDADRDALHFPERAEQLAAAAGGISYRQARRNVEIVEEMNRQLEGNLPEQLVFSSGFARLAG